MTQPIFAAAASAQVPEDPSGVLETPEAPPEPPRKWKPRGESFKLADGTYHWRSIGARDASSLVTIAEEAITFGLQNAYFRLTSVLQQGLIGGGLAALLIPLMALPNIEPAVFSLLESLVINEEGYSLPAGSLSDPEVLGVDDVPELLKSLDAHPQIAGLIKGLTLLPETQVWQQAKVWFSEAMRAMAEEDKKRKEEAQMLEAAQKEQRAAKRAAMGLPPLEEG